jgi:hypothetical protein
LSAGGHYSTHWPAQRPRESRTKQSEGRSDDPRPAALSRACTEMGERIDEMGVAAQKSYTPQIRRRLQSHVQRSGPHAIGRRFSTRTYMRDGCGLAIPGSIHVPHSILNHPAAFICIGSSLHPRPTRTWIQAPAC